MDIWNLIYERKSFFIDLCLEHLMISAIAIVIAIAAGGLIGILLSEYPRFSRPVIGVVNFLYTIPSISMLGFLIPLSGHRKHYSCSGAYHLCPASDGEKHIYRHNQRGSCHDRSGRGNGKHPAADSDED